MEQLTKEIPATIKAGLRDVAQEYKAAYDEATLQLKLQATVIESYQSMWHVRLHLWLQKVVKIFKSYFTR